MTNVNIVCYKNDQKTTHTVQKGDYIVDTWSLDGTLPDGITFSDGVITCNAKYTFNKTEYRVTAGNDGGNGTLDITIMVDIAALISFSYTETTMVFPYEYLMIYNIPNIQGEFSGFEINKALPEGIFIDQTDGHFYGYAKVAPSEDIYTVTIKNPRNTLTSTVKISSESNLRAD